MSRRRFVAPARGAVEPACFQHPLFAGYASFQDWMLAGQWPDIEALNARLALPGHCFQAQEPALLDDGLHYEVRIAGRGQIATRAQNWHDLFNAMVWIRHPALKRALNRQQCRHVQVLGGADRNRAQAALTQFDESGVIVRVRERGLLARWDAHDWPGLFDPAPWREGAIAVATVFGHALMEQALLPARRLVGKCLLVWADDDAAAIDHVAEAIDAGTTLLDPLQLRPLPLAGIPGWHRQQTPAFYADADYFRPLREGRHYPPPLSP